MALAGQVMKARLKRMIAPRILGALDYYRFPESRQSWGGPLNGQQHRQAMVVELFEQLGINAVVETGTFRGTTTEFFSKLCLGPVLSVEADDRLYGYAKMRLLFQKNVTLFHGDSREVLQLLANARRLAGRRVFFYLDAHWGHDFPLADELDLVFTHWPKSVALVDDFQVPDDPGYGYDDYGPNAALTLGYARPIMEKHALRAYFPAVDASGETGARRGCALFAGSAELVEMIGDLATLRHHRTAR